MNLGNIINQTIGIPTIVNEESKFVVVTYWWGRDNDNSNIARPCISFFQELVNETIKYINNYLLTLEHYRIKTTIYQFDSSTIIKDFSIFKKNILTTTGFKTIISKYAKKYKGSIQDDVKHNSSKVNMENIKLLSDVENIEMKMTEIMLKMIEINKDNLYDLFLLNLENNNLRLEYTKKSKTTKVLLDSVKKMNKDKKKIDDNISTKNKQKTTHQLFGKLFDNHNILNKRKNNHIILS
jgi:hypothetical protein